MRFHLLLTSAFISACNSVSPFKDGYSENDYAKRAELTPEACQALGGDEVGDIGDGKIHRLGYLCADGEPPLGVIKRKMGEHQPIEGSVCCQSFKQTND